MIKMNESNDTDDDAEDLEDEIDENELIKIKSIYFFIIIN
jgi:hypothetical protein